MKLESQEKFKIHIASLTELKLSRSRVFFAIFDYLTGFQAHIRQFEKVLLYAYGKNLRNDVFLGYRVIPGLLWVIFPIFQGNITFYLNSRFHVDCFS